MVLPEEVVDRMRMAHAKLTLTDSGFSLADDAGQTSAVRFDAVREIYAVRVDSITFDTLGLSFELNEGAFEVFEGIEGFWELWRALPRQFNFPEAMLDAFWKSQNAKLQLYPRTPEHIRS